MTHKPLIPDDVSRCINSRCLLRHRCARHEQLKHEHKVEREGYISITRFGNTNKTPTTECGAFIPIPKSSNT